jgi:hypothetical protein
MPPASIWLLTVAILFCVSQTAAVGQEPILLTRDLPQERVLPPNLESLLAQPVDDAFSSSPWARCPLFRMPQGISNYILNLDTDAAPIDPNALPAAADLYRDYRYQVTLNADNPNLDFRRPYDQGGIGFYRLNSQFMLTDTQAGGVSMGFQAVTPAGLEAGGLADGPTVVSPHLAWFYDLDGGTALQGFIGKDVHARAGWSDGLQRKIRYGVALQSPFPGTDTATGRGAHFFLEALGRTRFDTDSNSHPLGNWDLVPGIQWRWHEVGWISGGILMPLDASIHNYLWQITCSWQF